MGADGLEYMLSSDGYNIILASLEHYLKRLRAMGEASVNEAGMLGSVIQAAATKRYPLAHETLQHVRDFLAGGAALTVDDMDIIKSSLECYRSDIHQSYRSPDSLESADALASKIHVINEAIAGIKRSDS